MAVTEGDISWPMLRQIVQDWAGPEADVSQVLPLDGGSINSTLQLTLNDGQKLVLKISPHRVNRSYCDEAHQLSLLRAQGVPVPRVHKAVIGSLDQPHSYLLMEFVEGIDLGKARRHASPDEFETLQRELADLVTLIHAVTQEQFGRVHHDGHVPADSWPGMYREIYQPIFDSVESSPLLPVKTRRRMAKIHDRLYRLIDHDDKPRLLHGDLWNGNLLVHRNGDGGFHIAAVLDPNCKYAHAESEIAYLELFHTANHTFLKSYQQQRRLGNDYHRVRKPVYQLYELMNHVHLFGSEYVRPFCETLDRIPL